VNEQILVVDDEISMRRMLDILFTQEGYLVQTAENAEAALAAINSRPFDLVVSDIRMPSLSGIDLLRRLKGEDSQAEVILMTAYASTDSAIEALKLGAFDYVTKPFQVEELVNIVRHALEKKALKEENVFLKAELSQQEKFGDIVGRNPRMREVYAFIERIASTSSSVLIQGESGTGKELVARAIHQRSSRAGRPFVAINCGGLTETLLESELFGHAKGSFTGAIATKKGLFDVASGGTLFLDEIGETSPAMQVKLLRALQERAIRPIGSEEEHAVDARVLAATNQDLQRMIQEKRFREDLYYRVNVISIQMPPLRERREDIPLLVRFFTEKYSRLWGREVPAITQEAMRILERYQWPGNVRELENVIERAMALAQSQRIESRDLPDEVRGAHGVREATGMELPESGFRLDEFMEGVRAAYVQRAMDLEGGVMVRAAKRLGITFRSMRYYVKKYGLQAKEN
jgi:two-component system, NtrC family, response regulator PilR